MRTILVGLTIVLFLIISLPLWLVFRFIGLFNEHAMAAGSQKVIAWIFRVVLKLAGGHLTTLGVENVPADRAVLYVGNHRSYTDIPMGYTTVPNLTGFVAKKEIAKVPGLSWWMRNMHCLFLDRKDMRQGLKTILKAIDYVNAGYSMFIMPEGTRNHGEELLPFKEGSFKIAEKSGCPIIPVAISNSDALYELSKPWIHSADLVIHYGKPIEVKELSREEKKNLSSMVKAEIEKMLAEDKIYIKSKK